MDFWNLKSVLLFLIFLSGFYNSSLKYMIIFMYIFLLLRYIFYILNFMVVLIVI